MENGGGNYARAGGTVAVVNLLLLTAAAGLAAEPGTQRRVTQVSEGIYVIQHRTEPFEGGNTTVIVGDSAAMVIDTCMLPYAAREDIAAIASFTDKPVRYVVNTHWHNDHVMGNADYADTYPGAIFVAHEETRRDMDLNIPNAAGRSVQAVQARAEEAGNTELGGRLRRAAADYGSHRYQRPTLIFDETLVVDLGNMEVRLERLGRGNTNGDIVAYVADERIAVTGDLLVSPLPYFYDGYPTEWVRTLDRLAGLEARVVVPGHGNIQHDWAYLELVRDMMRAAILQVDARLHVIGPAEFKSFSDVEDHVDLGRFRDRFVLYGADETEFDQTARQLAKLVFKEASLR